MHACLERRRSLGRRASGLLVPEGPLVALPPPPPPPPPPQPFPFAFWKSGLFDPGTLNLTGWWVGDNFNQGGGIWNGKASLGTSGGHALTINGALPTSGPALNGHGTVSFVSPQSLTTGVTADQFISVSAYSGWALVDLVGVTTDFSTGTTAFQNNCVYRVGGFWWVIGFRSTGPALTVDHWTSGAAASLAQATTMTIGQYHLAMWRYDGTNLQAKVDGNPWQTVTPVANILAGGLAGGWVMGDNAFHANVADSGVSQQVFSDTTFDKIRTGYINPRYGLAL